MAENPDLLAFVDRARCEARGPCVGVCPVRAIRVRPVSDADRQAMGALARMKLWAHGGSCNCQFGAVGVRTLLRLTKAR